MDYVELVDWTGRIVRDDKRGGIHSITKPILERLGIQAASWLQTSNEFEALSEFDEEDRKVAKAVLESLILKHNAKRAFVQER